MKLLFACLALAAPALSRAAISVSLITVSPGPSLFESFGHAMIMTEDSEKPGTAHLYEYGGVYVASLLSGQDILGNFQKLFSAQLKSGVRSYGTTLDAATKLPLSVKVIYLSDLAIHREVILDPIDLDERQTARFIGLIESDAKTGTYSYDSFRDNCVTRIRDHLFDASVLTRKAPAIDPKTPALDSRIDTSLQQIARDSIDEAAALSCAGKPPGCQGTVTLFPGSFRKAWPRKSEQAESMLRLVGMPASFHGASELYAALMAADALFHGMNGGEAFSDAYHEYFFGKDMTERPVERYKTLYTPRKLREALLELRNPATGNPVVVASKAIRAVTPEMVEMH